VEIDEDEVSDLNTSNLTAINNTSLETSVIELKP